MVGKPTSLDASLLTVPKGEARGLSEDQAPARPPRPAPVSKSGRGFPASWRHAAEDDVPRVALTVRLPVELLERLREAAHDGRIQKQRLVEIALATTLKTHGY